jgi:hypothetical protein
MHATNAIIALAVILIIVATATATMRRRINSATYTAAPSLLTPAELAFKNALEPVIPGGTQLMAKVRLADIINVHESLQRKDWAIAFNRIQSKHIDFLLCDQATSKILCAIELHDKTHQRPKRADRDKFVRIALAMAGVPFLEITARARYDSTELAKQLGDAIKPKPLAGA